jgi:hypothetical protein
MIDDEHEQKFIDLNKHVHGLSEESRVGLFWIGGSYQKQI